MLKNSLVAAMEFTIHSHLTQPGCIGNRTFTIVGSHFKKQIPVIMHILFRCKIVCQLQFQLYVYITFSRILQNLDQSHDLNSTVDEHCIFFICCVADPEKSHFLLELLQPFIPFFPTVAMWSASSTVNRFILRLRPPSDILGVCICQVFTFISSNKM